jgi:hypothetical protein
MVAVFGAAVKISQRGWGAGIETFGGAHQKTRDRDHRTVGPRKSRAGLLAGEY